MVVMVFICIKFIFNGRVEYLLKNSSSMSVKFEPEFLISFLIPA